MKNVIFFFFFFYYYLLACYTHTEWILITQPHPPPLLYGENAFLSFWYVIQEILFELKFIVVGDAAGKHRCS